MLAVYGAGGFALQILGMVEAIAAAGEPVCFVDDRLAGGALLGLPVRTLEEIGDDAVFAIAVSDPNTRQRIAARLGRFRELRAKTAAVSPHAFIGDGAILCEHTIIEPSARIGRHFHGNIYSYVAHECVIGDFVTFAPKASCNGRVKIGDQAYIGAGAVLKQGISVGAGATVGMGSVVINDVPEGMTVVGNPARVISETKSSGS